jgi:SAM-dependent methyltransferase
LSYGTHILSTGSEVLVWENVFGRYIYDSRFRGRDPILDIGAGRCWFTRQNPSTIRGLDIEEKIVLQYRQEGLKIYQGSVYEIPFPSEMFSGVFCCWLFEHLADPETAIKEVVRVLGRGGYACLIVPSPRTLLRTFYDDYTHVHPFTEASLVQLGQTGGFAEMRISSLFWTRGGGRLSRRFGERLVYKYLQWSDRVGRRIGLLNRDNLVLEAWK